jgi:hypothetical protein
MNNIFEDIKNCTDPINKYLCIKCIPDNIDKCHEGDNAFTSLFHYCSINDVFGIVSVVLNLLFYISPILELQQIKKSPIELQNFPRGFLFSILINASVQFGIVIHALQYLPYVFITNSLGILINLSYLAYFLYYLLKPDIKKILLMMIVIIAYLVLVIIFFYYLPFFIYFNCKEVTLKPDIINDIRVSIPIILINTMMLIAPLQNLVKKFFNFFIIFL